MVIVALSNETITIGNHGIAWNPFNHLETSSDKSNVWVKRDREEIDR
jgi:hypothetical protein